MKDTIDNETKCLMYALNLANSEYKPQIQHTLNQLYQFKIDSTMTVNSKSNPNANENARLANKTHLYVVPATNLFYLEGPSR